MSARIIDGKEVNRRLKEEIRQEVEWLKSQGIVPSLAMVSVGSDPASQLYAQSKAKACSNVGIQSKRYALPADVPERELLGLLDELNRDPEISGILVEFPLPPHIDPQHVAAAISTDKDVDAFNDENMGRLLLGNRGFAPCTPSGVMELLRQEGVTIPGANCVVVGKSNIVGKPMAMMLLNQHATVTVCHLHTKDLAHYTRQADVLIVAIGDPKFITADYVKEGAVVIDIGINRLKDGTVCGDVDFDSVKEKCAAITPVPGSVGPMTVTMLLKHTVEAARRLAKQK